MNATELYVKDGRSAGVWYCEKCKQVHEHRVLAEECCKPQICGCGAECADGWTMCNKCRSADKAAKERERFDRSEKVTEWEGPVYHPTLDIYARDISELLETLREIHRPTLEYVWTCKSVPIYALDTDRIVDEAVTDFVPESMWEIDPNGLAELRQAIEHFNNANKDLVYWEVDYNKAMVLDDFAKALLLLELRWRPAPP